MLVSNHSVTLDKNLCKGCTNCIKRCPTQAIRVKYGKAIITNDLCIDCGECIRQCPYHAKKAKADSLRILNNYTYKIALPAPSLYGQFPKGTDINLVLNAFLEIGFDHVFEVSRGAEVVSKQTKKMLEEGRLKTPVISSACPAVPKVVRIRFPSLCDNLLPIASPMQIAGRMARYEAVIKKGLSDEKIGVFFISPCSAKITEVIQPIGTKQSFVNGAFSMAEIVPMLMEAMKKVENPKPLLKSGIKGVKWAGSGGEASAILPERYLAADGMENIMSVLEELEDDRLQELDFIELNACPGGCVGGVLTTENPYVARARIQDMQRADFQEKPNNLGVGEKQLLWNDKVTDAKVMQFSRDRKKAFSIMVKIEQISSLLPEMDCGSCGAPTCRALAEDVVLGKANLTDCMFMRKDKAHKYQKEILGD